MAYGELRQREKYRAQRKSLKMLRFSIITTSRLDIAEPTTTGGLSAVNKTMKPQLINGWKTWHKWWSTRLKIVGLLLISAPESIIAAWASIPHDFKEAIPNEWITTTGIFLVVASSFAQIVRQKDAHARANQDRHAAESKPRDSDVEKRGRR